MIVCYPHPNYPFISQANDVYEPETEEIIDSVPSHLTMSPYPEITWITTYNDEIECIQADIFTDSLANYLFHLGRSIHLFFARAFHVKDWKGPFPSVYIEKNQNSEAWICQNTVHEEDEYKIPFREISVNLSATITHLYVRRMIQSLRPLSYSGQSGALIEHLASVFAIACELSNRRRQIHEWEIAGKDFTKLKKMDSFTPNEETCSQIIHKDNSKIPDHAFYQVITNLEKECFHIIVGIWFAAFRDLPSENATFSAFAKKTITMARKADKSFYRPHCKLFSQVITQAWRKVGVRTFFYQQKGNNIKSKS